MSEEREFNPEELESMNLVKREVGTAGKSIRQARITLTENVVHQSDELDPLQVSTRAFWWIESDEEPYDRRCKATEEWKKLDLGWITDPGLILIRNEEGRFFNGKPSPEEAEEAAAKGLEIAYEGFPHGFVVGPGLSLRITPTNASGLVVRCHKGTGRFRIVVYPK